MPDQARPAPDRPESPAPRDTQREAPDRSRLLWLGKIALRVALLAAVLWLVWHELRHTNFRMARDRLESADAGWLLAAIAAAGIALGFMGLYDVLAFRSTPTLRPARRWGLGLLFFAWTNFLTLGPIGGPAVRLYFYRKEGLEPGEIVRGLARLYSGMFGGLAGWVVAAILPLGNGPLAIAGRAAIALTLAPLLSIAAARIMRRIRPEVGPPSSTASSAALGLVGAMDWLACVVAFILAGHAIGATTLVTDQIRAVFVGHVVGILSMVPGGLGSADAVWLKMLTAHGEAPTAAAAHIVLFRLVFYVLPWLGSLIGLYVTFSGRTPRLMRWQRRVLAGALAINAALLLASTATPSIASRLRVVQDLVPLDAVEASHAVSVVAAAIMFFLIRGILRGYRAAFIVAGATLVASAIAHTLKGGDFEEAAVSLAMVILLLGAHRAFTRRGRIPIGWELTLAAALGSIIFFMLVGLAAFPHVRFSQTLWDRAYDHARTGRLLRGIALIGAVGLVFLLRQAVMPRRTAAAATGPEIDAATEFIRSHAPRAATLNIGSGDKGVWFWRSDGGGPADPPAGRIDGLAVYQRRGSKLVVFSDPVVDHARADEFLEDLHAFAADQDLNLVFYQLTGDWMQHLHDFGYTFFKLGEEAVVPLAGFSLQGGPAHGYRKTIRKVEAEGATFQVLRPPYDDALIAEARAVSDAWLASKGIQEMQFSLGYFSPEYIKRSPLAVVRDSGGRMVGFMNLLGTHPRPTTSPRAARPPTKPQPPPSEATPPPSGELTGDMMRYIPGIDLLMDYMIVNVMMWAAQEGYATLNLGMCPLYDVGEYRKASIPERLARLLFEHGERIYNYRGLHAFKEKFRPVWEPRFMAYQRPWDWPSAVLTSTALIWGRSPADRRRITAARTGIEHATRAAIAPAAAGH